MGATTEIQWSDATWNPTVGCTKVSPGCDHCYAETLVNRFAGKNKGFPNRFDVMTIRDDKHLTLPLRWRDPKKVFVNSLSDLFHSDLPDSFIARVLAVVALSPQHTYQLLTKRPARMRSLLSSDEFYIDVLNARTLLALDNKLSALEPMPWPLPNLWLGVSVEDQRWADIRIPVLLNTPAVIRFLSCEPLLGPVVLRPEWMWVLRGVHWVICGGESGPGARPMYPGWARALRDQCNAAGVPYHFKQWGNWAQGGAGSVMVGIDGTFCPTLDNRLCAITDPAHVHTLMSNHGKKAAGRELDGRTWDEFPVVA